MKVLSLEEMRLLEQDTFKNFLSEQQVISCVARDCFKAIEDILTPQQQAVHFLLLAGTGNNGADLWALAEILLKNYSASCSITILKDYDLSDCSQQNQFFQKKLVDQYSKLNVIKGPQLDNFFKKQQKSKQCLVIIDGLFGIGFRTPLDTKTKTVLKAANHYRAENPCITIAIDVPSGISIEQETCDQDYFRADYTLTVAALKKSFYSAELRKKMGSFYLIAGGFPSQLLDRSVNEAFDFDAFETSFEKRFQELMRDFFPERDIYSHKGDNGKLVLAGGSKGLCGALLIASRAGLTCGTGLVQACSWREQYLELAARLNCDIMAGEIENVRATCDCLVVGPGIGIAPKNSQHKEKIQQFITQSRCDHIVIDADIFKVFSLEEDVSFFRNLNKKFIWTPHLGELSRFMAASIEQVRNNPIFWAQKMATQLGGIVVLKSSTTIIATQDRFFVHHFPNEVLARGGSGDLLAGLLGGMIAQFVSRERKAKMEQKKQVEGTKDIFDLVICAVHLHAQSALLAKKDKSARSVTSEELLKALAELIYRYE